MNAGSAMGQSSGRSFEPRVRTDATAGGVVMFKPDVIVQVEEHELGPEVLTIQMQRGDYPPDLLRKQIEAIGRYNNSNVRGIQIGTTEVPTSQFKFQILTAQFATDNLIDRSTGKLRMTPIIQAFAGAPAPFQVDNMSIIFVNEKAQKNTIQAFADDYVHVAGRESAFPPGLDYQVRYLTQDPSKIDVPDLAEASHQSVVDNVTQATGMPIWVLVLAIVMLAGSIGVVVYVLAMRPKKY